MTKLSERDLKLKSFTVKGMNCSACSARVEKIVSETEGVTGCSVSLLTGIVIVEGEVRPEKIISAIEAGGYQACLRKEELGISDRGQARGEEEAASGNIKKRVLTSVLLLCPLMYVSMGYVMWKFPLPGIIEENPVFAGTIEGVLATGIIIVNREFFTRGFQGIRRGAPNMDTLVSIGASAAYIYSLIVLFGTSPENDHILHNLYFEAAGMIFTLITVGKMMETIARGKTGDALKSLMKLAPAEATVLREGRAERVSADALQVGDVFLVKPGESIPVDGVVLEGESAVNEAMLTGESLPADKKTGDEVAAATINQSGFLKCRAVRTGRDTTLARIIQMVTEASATKAPIARTADKVAGYFVPVVTGIALMSFAAWMMAGKSLDFALARGIAVLVISCPCALGLATPAAIMVGSGVGAKMGILFKTSEALEELGKADTIIFDKTGTLTEGCLSVTDIVPFAVDENRLIELAASLETRSEHPLGMAVCHLAFQRGIETLAVEAFAADAGNGLRGMVEGKLLVGGSERFIKTFADIPEECLSRAGVWADQGKTPMFFAWNERFIGAFAATDTVKTDAEETVRMLKKMRLKVIMLTGDNARTAGAIGKKVGVETILSEVLPQDKVMWVKKEQKKGKVIMAGDGINDAPALVQANIGVAMGGGTDVACDAADVVIMKNNMKDILTAVRLSRQTLKNVYENLFWAFCYNIVGIPLAAGVWIPLFGWELNPMFAAGAMSISSLLVIGNALRLKRFS